jgi:transcriptional regulator with XRE-family HTH domain
VHEGRSSDLRRAWPALANELKELRSGADLSTRQLARELKWSQGKVHKIEHTLTLPSMDDVEAWLRVTDAPANQAVRLLDLAERAQHEAVMVRARRRAGEPIDLTELQEQTRRIEASAKLIRVFAPILIPGLLQTPDYARLVVLAGEPDNPTITEAIAGRMQRQAILYEEGREFEFVLSEAALRWRFGPVAVQVGQLRQLQTFSILGNVLVAVLPLDRETPVWHGAGFTLFEDRLDEADPMVHLEALATFENIAEPALVGRYQQTLNALRDLAVTGHQARALLEQVRGELHG